MKETIGRNRTREFAEGKRSCLCKCIDGVLYIKENLETDTRAQERCRGVWFVISCNRCTYMKNGYKLLYYVKYLWLLTYSIS